MSPQRKTKHQNRGGEKEIRRNKDNTENRRNI